MLVFDEATAALDNRTEKELSDTIQQLRGCKTLLIVAHRLTTVRECSHLVFLRDGTIAAVGTYDDLLGRDPEFRRLAAAFPVAEPRSERSLSNTWRVWGHGKVD